MSFALNHVLSTWKDVLAKLRRRSICWHGIPLSERDRLTFTEAIVMWAIALIDMSSPYGILLSEREYIGWAMQIASVDVAALGTCLSECIDLLRSVYKPVHRNWFKRQLCDRYPFIGLLIAPIREPLARFLSQPNAEDFTFCYQFFSFITHVSLQDLQLDLEDEYIELERSLHEIDYEPDMLFELNSIMRSWLADLRIDESNYLPSHGPGAVAELPRTAGNLAKYSVLSTDALLDYFLRHSVGASAESFSPYPLKELDRTSVLVFVPKSLKTKRTISKEPAALVYHQKAVWDILMEFIHKHPVLSSHIQFLKQELNGELALMGSSAGDFATIDLSSASDRVTLTLVKSVFRGTPLYSALVSLRSRYVKLPSGKILRVEKYAPMGSALCFPVQTLIFSALVEYAARRTHSKWGFQTSAWRVYGDDIIVPDPFFWDLVDVLKRVGFKVNTSKSYSRPYRFRESCGYEGYDGTEVTPMKISRRFYSVEGPLTSHHASLYEGLIDMANNAYRYQFPLLRAYVIRLILNNTVGVPLFSGSTQLALISPCPDNFRAPYRGPDVAPKRLRDPWYQREEILVVTGASTLVKGVGQPALEEARYFETLRLSLNRSGDMFEPTHLISVPRGPMVLTLRRRWVEKPICE